MGENMQLLFFGKIKHYMEKCVDGIAVLFFTVIFFVAMAQIVMRWMFNSPIIWSEELIRLMYVWLCYLGWTIASRNRTHIKITVLVSAVPPFPRKLLETFNCLLVIFFSLFMVYYGIKMTEVGGRGRAVTLPINFAIVYGIAPAANLIILLYQLLDIINIWKKPEPSAEARQSRGSPQEESAS